jgi:deazaflavin-dependent oxidoreductase (nitroreductase family)
MALSQKQTGLVTRLKDRIALLISRSPLRKPIVMLNVLAYRLSSGKLGGKYRALPVLLITTKGRKTGKERTWPVAYIQDGDSYIVTGSNAGRANHPAWLLNLQGTPHATIQVGSVKQRVAARQATPDERSRLWQMLTKREPHYDEYQEHLDRQIQMMILKPDSRPTRAGGAAG